MGGIWIESQTPDRRSEGISVDAYGFDISISSLVSVFNPGACIQIKVVGFDYPTTLVESIVLSQKHRKMELQLNPR